MKLKISKTLGTCYPFSLMTTESKIFQAAIFSLFFHLLVFGWLPFLGPAMRPQLTNRLLNKALKVERISPQALKRYRRRGVKGGKKGFSLPTGTKRTAKTRSKKKGIVGSAKQKTKSKSSDSKDLSLKNLAAGIDFKKIIDEKKSKKPSQGREKKTLSENQRKAIIKKEIIAAESGLPLTSLRSSQTVNNFRRQERLRRNLIKEMGTNSTASEVLGNTNFNLHFEPPEGVSEDELNSVEKIFYSFQKRTFVSYVNSFYSTYQDIILQKPTLLSAFRNEKHLMTGKVIFDREGNIVRIKILRSSTNDDLHELFETTLKEIRSLPNPPNDLIKNREEFTIYYQLRIN